MPCCKVVGYKRFRGAMVPFCYTTRRLMAGDVNLTCSWTNRQVQRINMSPNEFVNTSLNGLRTPTQEYWPIIIIICLLVNAGRVGLEALTAVTDSEMWRHEIRGLLTFRRNTMPLSSGMKNIYSSTLVPVLPLPHQDALSLWWHYWLQEVGVASKGKLLIRVAKIGQFKSTIMAVYI